MASQNFEKKNGKYLTRRDFLKAGGAVMASAVLFNSLSSCSTSTTTTTATTSTLTTATTTTKSPLGTTSTRTPKYGGILRGDGGPGGSQTPFGWPPELIITHAPQAMLETLMRGDDKGGIQPWLAESYKLADDLKSITFNLRKGIKFHDGSDFNAAVAKWNLDNMIAAEREPTWASVDLIDDYTVRVNLKQWSVAVPLSFAEGMTMAYMVSKESFDKNGVDWIRWNAIGTGPFIQVENKLDVGSKIVKNPNYWVKGKPYLDEIDTPNIADYMTLKMAMETGELEEANIQPNDTAHFKELGWNITYIPHDIEVLIFDTANADSPYANQKVREAVEYAIDKEGLAKAFGYGYRIAPYQIPPRNSLVYDPNFTGGRKYDLVKAKQLLTEAGYPDGFDTKIFQFPNAQIRDLTIAVQAALAKVGIRAQLEFPEQGAWMTNYGGPTGKWPKGTMLFHPVARLDKNFLGGLQAVNTWVGQSWLRTPEWTQAYNAALGAPAVDLKLIRAVTDIMTRDASFIPITEVGAFYTQKPYVHLEYDQRAFVAFYNLEEVWLNK